MSRLLRLTVTPLARRGDSIVAIIEATNVSETLLQLSAPDTVVVIDQTLRNNLRQNGTAMKTKRLVFSGNRWAELRKSGDILTLEILDLMGRRGIGAVIDRTIEIDQYIFVPERGKKRGAKPKWDGGKALYAWLEVEAELILARRTNPKATPSCVMQAKFRSLKGKSLRVVHDMSGRNHLEIANPKTAIRRHSEGKRLLKSNPTLAARWKDLLSRAVEAKTSRATRNFPR